MTIERSGAWVHDGEALALSPGGGLLEADAVFPVLHGPFGEDGTVQGLLELLDVPYVGAGVLASSLCMDKVVFKEVLAAADVPQVAYAGVREHRWRAEPDAVRAELAVLGTPVFVKPARLGSSVGIAKAWAEADLDAALEAAFAHDGLVIVEAFSGGIEVECSVIGLRRARGVGARRDRRAQGRLVRLRGQVHRRRHGARRARAACPTRSASRSARLAVDTFVRVGCAGLARVDFFVEGDRVLVNELNTMPGFTQTSVYPKLWEASGVARRRAVRPPARLALERYDAERSGHAFSARDFGSRWNSEDLGDLDALARPAAAR